MWRATGQALKRDGIAAPRIALCGLNPMPASTAISGEEIEVINPAAAAARSKAG